MRAKIKAVFKATNNDVKMWRKCKQKVTFINEVANLAYIYDNFVFENTNKSRAEIRHEKLINKLLTNSNYFYIMKQLTKIVGKEIAKQVSKEFANFESENVTFDKKSQVYNVTFWYDEQKPTDGEMIQVIRRKGQICNDVNGVEYRYIYDVKNGVTTDKKRLISIAKNDVSIDCNASKQAVKPNLEGIKTTIAQNFGVDCELINDCDFSDIVTAKTLEQKIACFLFAVAKSANFEAIATKVSELAKQAEKETRKAKATENSYITICKDNNIAVTDFENALQITNNKNEAVQACLIAKKTGKTIQQAVEAYRLIFA